MLNERDREIINCMARVWAANDAPIPGGICYNDVFELLERLGADKPVAFIDYLERLSKWRPDSGESLPYYNGE